LHLAGGSLQLAGDKDGSFDVAGLRRRTDGWHAGQEIRNALGQIASRCRCHELLLRGGGKVAAKEL
jgi:hypothetical protein